MIYVTREAKKDLEKFVTGNKGLHGTYLRIVDKGHGELGLVADGMRPDDQVVECDGKVLLVAEPQIAATPRSISLDAYTVSNALRIVISEEIINHVSSTVTVNWIPCPQLAYHPN
jgi:hypothetical protein